MTSTPQSTRSNFSWRAAPKKKAPTSVSFILAKPENGAPLASAVTQLPMSRRPSDMDMKSSKEGSSTRGTPQTADTPLLTVEPRASPTATNDEPHTMSDTGSNSVVNAGVQEQSNVDEAAASTLPSTSSSLTVKASPPRSSWFGSMSRGTKSSQKRAELPPPKPTALETPRKDAPAAVLTQPAPTADVSGVSSPPAMAILPPTPPRPPAVPAPATAASSSSTVPISIPVKRTWFSPASSPSPTPAQSPPPPPPVAAAIASPLTPSSIDSEVPLLSTSEPSAPMTSPGVVSGDASQHLSSLNPSTSRFSLSIPFLGRPKLPLEKALASATAVDVREPTSTALEPSDNAETPQVVEEADASAVGEFGIHNCFIASVPLINFTSFRN
ncbi:hypothetical protein FA95DRAFT_966156 [Auriscalpium vulgare]|uniref:Uncharacterized protein n=1 Tax=Auriscalpium vulgare TaxID=40419 RepID=A0ACB8RY35_9AGAM|nr:hypothetical protein FA95DRAFT_966156 [Auriscalpium vulgare]